MKVTLTRNMRIGGRMYRTGDAAPLARQHARVLIATGRAKQFVEPPVAAAPAPTPPLVARQVHQAEIGLPAHPEHSGAHHDANNEGEAAPAAEAVRSAPYKAAPAAKRSPGPKVTK